MKKILILLALLLPLKTYAGFTGANSASGEPGENKFRAGLLFGNVGLSTTPNNESTNAIGLGGLFGYSIADELALELAYVRATHSDLKQSDYSLGATYYFGSYEPFFFHATGGVSFTNASLSLSQGSMSDTAFGLFIGAGADIFTKRNLIIGLQARYYDMFGSSKTFTPTNTSYQLVNSYYTILVRLLFQF